MNNLISKLNTDWKQPLKTLIEPYASTIDSTLTTKTKIVPPKHLIFDAFNKFNIQDTKVVIISQDPYIKPGEAMGLCFSVPNGFKIPPSLRNIFKELERSYSLKRTNTDLSDWADQGVLLLNTSLTTIEGISGQHMAIWKDFTKEVIKYLTGQTSNIVYILWGAHAQTFESLIPTDNLILKHSHPSPLSRVPFVGNNHFILCNTYLEKHFKQPIDWFKKN